MSRLALLLVAISSGAGVILALGLISGRISFDGGAADGAPARLPGDAAPPRRLFAPDSVWNRPLSPRAELDPSSGRLVAALGREVASEQRRGVGPWITASTCSTPIYVVPVRQGEVPVRLVDPDESWRTGLARVFRHVPLPAHARPAACSDAHLTVWQPARDRLWEFFGLQRTGSGWTADWGGAMRQVSRNRGFYDGQAWPGRSTFAWGATASSLPVAGGVMRLDELRSGAIEHALALNVPTARRGAFAWPAQRSDGVGSSSDLPEGARLRLDPSLDLESMGLPPLTLAIATAAQRYGILVRDQTGPGNGISFFGEAPRGAAKPYSEAGGFFEGSTPAELLASFPWASLQVLKMKLCRTGPCRR